MSSEYRRIDAGTDADGRRWEIGVSGTDVILDGLPPDLRFGARQRGRFTKAWADAERQAEPDAAEAEDAEARDDQ